MTSDSASSTRANSRAFRFLSNTLLFLMMACGILVLASLIRNALPGWHTGVIAGVLLFIVLDRMYTHNQVKTLSPLTSEWLISLGAQWLVILVCVRLLLSYASGVDSFLTDLSRFARGYVTTLLPLEFIMTMLLALLVWYMVGQFLNLLDEIGLDPEVALREEQAFVQVEAVPAHRRLVELIFSLGIGLVVLTVLSRLDFRAILETPERLPGLQWSRFSGGEAGALFYFVFGLALLSLSRLMSLQTHWNRLRIPVTSSHLARQWGIYSLAFLLIVAFLVGLLPSGDSFGLFSLLGTLFTFLITVLVFLSQVIVGLVLLLFSLPFLLFDKAPPVITAASPPPLPVLPTEPLTPIGGSEVWALIRSILLWGLLAAILVFSFLHFVRQHEGILAALRSTRITNWLVLAWQWLYRNVNRGTGSLVRVISDSWQGIRSRLEGRRILPRPGWISLRLLDPRRRIYFYYLAMVRRSGEQGLGRKPSQTPSEYADGLQKALPSAGEDIGSLTEAFIQARYSRQEVDPGKEAFVKAAWGRIRRALQTKPKKG